MHHKSVRERKRALSKIQREVSDRHTQNKELENQVLEYQILVAERDMVENLAGKEDKINVCYNFSAYHHYYHYCV